jgi:hypothetical protein
MVLVDEFDIHLLMSMASGGHRRILADELRADELS